MKEKLSSTFGICFLIIGFIQFFAIIAGVTDWWNIHWLFAGIISLIVAYIPILGSIVGVMGAVEGWNWHVGPAILLFGFPYLIFLFSFLFADKLSTKNDSNNKVEIKPKNRESYFTFRANKMSDYIMYWRESHLAQSELIKERDQKGFNYNKSLNNPNEEYSGGYKPYNDYKQELEVSYEEYYEKFKQFDEEYEVKMTERKKQLCEKYDFSQDQNDYSIIELLFINSSHPYSGDNTSQEILDHEDCPEKLLAKWHIEGVVEDFGKDKEKLKEFVEKVKNIDRWTPWLCASAQFKIEPWHRKEINAAKDFHSKYIDELNNQIIDIL